MRTVVITMGLAACSSVEGTVSIEGSPVVFETCTSLVPKGFEGVDLEIDDGRTLRLFREGETVSSVGFFDDAASDAGLLVGGCATGSIRDTNTSKGEVVLLEGEASFDCTDPLTIGGDVTFRGCGK